MAKQDGLFSAARHSRDLYVDHRTEESVLNASILGADITRSFEEYVEIFEVFYADDVEVSSGASKKTIRGKAAVRSILLDFLIPLHVMAEIAGLSVSLRSSPIPGELAHETHASWTLDLVAPSGKTCTLMWRTFRKWSGMQVVCEHHYDHQQIGGPLTFDDLGLGPANLENSFSRPSTLTS
jgi:hypothetical protein